MHLHIPPLLPPALMLFTPVFLLQLQKPVSDIFLRCTVNCSLLTLLWHAHLRYRCRSVRTCHACTFSTCHISTSHCDSLYFTQGWHHGCHGAASQSWLRQVATCAMVRPTPTAVESPARPKLEPIGGSPNGHESALDCRRIVCSKDHGLGW